VDMMRAAVVTEACRDQVLNLGSDSPETRIGDLARIVIDTVGATLEVDPQPATPGSPARRCPDMSRMTDLTGIRAGTSLTDGVMRTYEWYRKEILEPTSA